MPRAPKGINILVADDEPMNIEVIKNNLEQIGLGGFATYHYDGQALYDNVKRMLTEYVDAGDFDKPRPVTAVLIDH